MKLIKILGISLTIILTGCGGRLLSVSYKEKITLDSLSSTCQCEFSYEFEKDFLKFGDRFDFKILVENELTNKDSFSYQAKKMARSYLRVMTEKEKIKDLIISFSNKNSSGQHDVSFTFDVHQERYLLRQVRLGQGLLL